jgi:hypothetical protein
MKRSLVVLTFFLGGGTLVCRDKSFPALIFGVISPERVLVFGLFNSIDLCAPGESMNTEGFAIS